MKSVLVFGGSGFIGSYLVEELISRKYNVTIADINPPQKNINFISCDILNSQDLENVFERNYDIVFNLAGFANLDQAVKEPIKTMELNLISNMKIIESCISNKIEKYVYASSAYAMSEKGSFYGISKLASEKSIEEYNKKYNLDFVIIRYGSVYSEKEFNNNYIYELVKKAVSENKIKHFGDGEEFREYIHAEDASKLSVDIIEQDTYTNKHVILTGSKGTKRKDLFNMINEILGGKVKIEFDLSKTTNHYKYTPYSFQSSISKKLIPNPQIDLGQGILEIIRKVHEAK